MRDGIPPAPGVCWPCLLRNSQLAQVPPQPPLLLFPVFSLLLTILSLTARLKPVVEMAVVALATVALACNLGSQEAEAQGPHKFKACVVSSGLARTA